MKSMIRIAASGAHIHPTAKLVYELFGHELSYLKGLGVPGNWVCGERLEIFGHTGERISVAIVAPYRSETQLHLSNEQAKRLGLEGVEERQSGDLRGTPAFGVKGPKGSVIIPYGAITEAPHIHMPEWMGYEDGDCISVSSGNVMLNDVPIKVWKANKRSDWIYNPELHIDREKAKRIFNGKIDNIWCRELEEAA